MSQETVGTLAAARPRSVRVFQRHHIDFCCGGDRPLAEACAERGLDPAVVLAEIEAEEAKSATQDRRWTDAPLPELIDHIVARHHRPLDAELPRLEELLRIVVDVHGSGHPELAAMLRVYLQLEEEVLPHMASEENDLFPRIRAGQRVDDARAAMRDEHEAVGALLHELRDHADGWRVPDGACGTWRALWRGLSELEADLLMHIHLENNVLLPRACA